MVAPINGGLVIELTYGPEVDWYKNVLAAGGCTIVWHGKEYPIHHLEVLDARVGRAAFPFPANLILRVTNRTHFVKMTA